MYTARQVHHLFQEKMGYAPALLLRAPGRINIIGEHTDYNQGLVLPGAIDKGLFFAVGTNDLRRLRVHALDIAAKADIGLDELKPVNELWVSYLLGVSDQFQQLAEGQLPGLDIVFGGDLPIGAGVSSSAALECGMAMAWNIILDTKLDRRQLAQLAQRSSHEFVGIPCGIMDQFASLHGVANHAILLDCRDLSFQSIPVAVEGCEWVLLNSKVSHNLADSAYAKRVEECATGVDILQSKFSTIQSLRDATPAQVEQLKGDFPGKVYERCRYIVGEYHRTLAMMKALAEGNAKMAGHLLNLTQMGLATDYEVSCPEIDFLFAQAFRHPAVHGARIMGGGFGGCTLNLVRSDERAAFIDSALSAYQQEFGLDGEELVVKLVDGVSVIN